MQTKITQFFKSINNKSTQVDESYLPPYEIFEDFKEYSIKSPPYFWESKTNEVGCNVYSHMLEPDYESLGTPCSPKSEKTWSSSIMELGINCEDEMEQQFKDEDEPSNGPIIFNSPPASPDPSPSPSPFVFSDGPEETTKHYPSEDEVSDESMDEVRRLYPSPPLSDRFFYISP